jgi:endo-1,4-beta-xylanase
MRPFSLFASFVLVSVTANAQQPTLKQAYNGCFVVGAALNSAQFTGKDRKGSEIIESQFNSISPENDLKWESIHPQPHTYNFGPSDAYVKFGQRNHMFVVGHTLVWHAQTPKWVFQGKDGKPATRRELLRRMRDHIKRVVGRYRGRVNGWDVVNEAVEEDGSLRESSWLKIIGPDYIEKAFEYAHKADPKAELYYNDYNLENEPKRKGALELIKKLKSEGVPVTGVGLQDHLNLDWPTAEQLNTTIDEFARLGMKVMITELDLDVLPSPFQDPTADVSLKVASNPKYNPYASGLPDTVQQQITNRWAELFRIYSGHCGVLARVTLWGVSDKDSWKNDWPIRGRTNFPLLFDRNSEAKPAVSAVIEAAPKNQ